MAILGGGPGGYEAALVAAQLGAEVTVVDRTGVGGSAVLTDCVPSKTLIATAELMTEVAGAGELGVELAAGTGPRVDLGEVNARVGPGPAQSEDIESRLDREKVRVVLGRGRLDGPETVVIEDPDGAELRSASPPTSCWSPLAPSAGVDRAHPTASASSPGSRSTTSRRCPSGWSSWGRG